MRISVALCTYNGGKYIAEQLSSILNQNYVIDEIQIGDDGSTDDTIDIINDFKKRHENIFLTLNQRRVGITDNFENTIKRCRGDYICLSDQDDIWHPDKLKIIIPVLQQNPKFQACFTNASFIDENGIKIDGSLWESYGVLKEKEHLLDPERLFEHLLRFGNIATGATMVLKAEAIKDIMPFTKRYNFEFHDFIIARKLAMNRSIIPINKKLMDYRLHEGQQAGVFNRKHWGDLFFRKKAIFSGRIKDVAYQKALYHAWYYYKSSVNEFRLKENSSNYLVRKCYVESKKEWDEIKKQSWSQYDCINDGYLIKEYTSNRKRSLCYFVCYTETTPDNSDLRYINELKKHFDQIVILTNYEHMGKYTDCEFEILDNKGYDFGFLYQAINGKDLAGYHSISFVNNSNILLKDKTLDEFFEWVHQQDSKFCGITDSSETVNELDESYHIQSHFLIFKDEAIILLQRFFTIINFERFFLIENQKQLRHAIIIECEIGLTQFMIRNRIQPVSWFRSIEFSKEYNMPLDKINLHIMFWKELIEKGYPLIKKKIQMIDTIPKSV
jgi:glycosyltransferase involved in cell wall biosynthesis